ncbi:MAG TPA: glucose-1-phosphate adenylyltransferase [Clostridiaceae bacterium]|nr:glucose-1-phosphate adenylyltransferase [Clostridiaceae bacterium]
MIRKEIIALLLAGGQGSRLGVLTKRIAKPAVLFGGKYRIIDFSLSNCINSGIDTVGVLTQYQPLKLNSHIGIGKPWDMDRMNGGLTILSPYLKGEIGEWYLGTANAVYQNIDYINKISPKYVIILSGDHVYKMNYSLMLDFHKEKGAEATISVIDVPIEEAPRYGIMNTDDKGRIYEFEEKPEHPKSTLASMGVYIFTWEVLRDYLIEDNGNPDSDHDFGKNIIPEMLRDGRSMWAYKFTGYWRDVGTIQAYWESNMDLTKTVPKLNLFDPAWRIYTPNPVKPPHYIAPCGNVKRSVIAEGCMIYGRVRNSVIFPGVYIEEGSVIEDSIVMSNSRICADSHLNKCIIGEHVVVGKNVRIGTGENIPNELKPGMYNSGITVVGEDAKIPDGTEIGRNVVIDIGAGPEDFLSQTVPSGKSIVKGGKCQ